MVQVHLLVKGDGGRPGRLPEKEGFPMLMMLHKPRRTPGEQVLAALAEGARRVAAGADAVLAAPFHWAENRRMLGDLAEMDDHALHDIGVTRSDLRDALSVPVLSDATILLSRRRAERQAAH